MSAPGPLLAAVQRTRRRALWLGLAQTALAGATVLCAGPLASTLVLPWVPERARPWVVAVALALALAGAAALALREWRRSRPLRSPAEAADCLAAVDPRYRERIRTGADLAAWGEEGAGARGASSELTAAQVALATAAVRGLRPAEAVPVGRAGTWLAWAALAATTLGVWAAINPGGAADVWASVLTGGPPAPVTVGNLELRSLPPAYTGLPEERIPGADGGVQGYPGTRVTLRGELSRRVEEGLWEGPGGRTIPLQLADGGFEVSWVLDQGGTYRLRFRQGNKEVPSNLSAKPIALTEDSRPRVEMEQPEGDLEVTTDQEVEVIFAAKDDFAVTKVELVLQGEQEVRIPVPVSAGPQVADRVRFLPLAYPQLGEGAHLRVEAWDGDTISGPKAGAGRSVYLTFLDKRRLLAEIEGLEERLFEALLSHLADHLEVGPPLEENLDRLRDKARDLFRLFEQLVERVRLGAEEGALGAVAVLRIEEGLRAVLEPFLAGGGHRREEIVAELEKDVLFLDELLRSLRMEQALSMGDELAALQRDLFDALDAGADRDELMARVGQIEDLLARMAELMSRSAAEMPESFANADAVKDMPQSELQQALQELREALAEGDLEAARELAESLLEAVNQWLAALEEAAQGAGQAAMDPLLAEMSDLAQEVGDMAAEQEEILEATRETAREGTLRAGQELREELESFLERQERRLQEIQGAARRMDTQAPQRRSIHGAGVPGIRPDEAARAALERMESSRRLRAGVAEVRQALREDLGRARQGTRALREAIDDLHRQVDAALPEADPRRQEAQAARDLAAAEAQAIQEDLDALGQRRLDGLTEEERRGLAELGQREEALGERARSLAERLEELAGQTPFLDPSAPGKARSAQGAMGQAGERLGEGDPYAATPPEARALEHLAELGQQLEGAQQQMMEGMQGQGMQTLRFPGNRPGGGRDVDRSRVEIPQEREARELRAFREEVLRAMGSGRYPKDYEEEVEDYYERLIR